MTPIFQRNGYDCLSAAVASVLDLKLEDVPDWSELVGVEWVRAVFSWAISRGLGVCYFDMRERKAWPILANHYAVLSGKTHRSEKYHHAVVVKATQNLEAQETRLDWVHDPMPGGDFISEPDHILFFIPPSQDVERSASDGKEMAG